ncbi:MAG TPA: tetratricopeptide repeat protein [Pyrinomonadaceae bacterium]|nr:tetratricopeptide repeat protein [Pyrinomonadaceae bacterium]
MPNPGSAPRRSLLPFLLSVVLAACASSFAQSRLADLPEGNREPPKLGVRIIEVRPEGQLEKAGIQVMDLLSRYGKFTVVDHSTYYKAREFYLKTPDQKVKVRFWRGRTPMTIEVLPGTIGGSTNEYNAVAYQLDSAMMRVNALKEIPEFSRMVEFKSEFENSGVEAAIAQAREIIDRAEADGSLTPTQILVGRIGLILDNAPEDELHKLNALLVEFVQNQPLEYIGWLGNKFSEQGHYRTARQLLKEYLSKNPDSILARLNLGNACLSLGLWTEAEAVADLALTNADDLWPEGLFMAYQQKAFGALSRSDYNTSIAFAEKAFAMNGGTIQIEMVQLAAALSGNMDKFIEATSKRKESLPKEFETLKLQIDSLEALALSVNGNDALAREVIARSTEKDRVEARLKNYWRTYPQGNKVVENWMRLSTN